MDHILLAYNEPEVNEQLSRALAFDGAVLMNVGGLTEARSALERFEPSLVISDLDLPDGSGLELLNELGEHRYRMPVVFLGTDLSTKRDKLPVQSNIDVLEKPFSVEELSKLARHRLNRHRTEPPPRSAFSVADYLQLAGIARRSVELSVSNGAGEQGTIIIDSGQPRWAQDQDGSGTEAFRRMALLPRADVTCRPLETVPIASNLAGNLEQLLLDAARSQDEDASKSTKVEEPSETAFPRKRTPSAPTIELAGGEQLADAAGRNQSSAPPVRSRSPAGSAVSPPSPTVEITEASGVERPRLRPVGGQARRPAPPRPLKKPTRASNALTSGTASSVPANRHTQKEKKVAPLEQISAETRTKAVLKSNPGLLGTARSGPDGSVIESAGEIDAETSCAVAALALRHVDELAADLGLGDVRSWQLSMTSACWYMVHGPNDVLVAKGGPNKNPSATLKKVEGNFRGSP